MLPALPSHANALSDFRGMASVSKRVPSQTGKMLSSHTQALSLALHDMSTSSQRPAVQQARLRNSQSDTSLSELGWDAAAPGLPALPSRGPVRRRGGVTDDVHAMGDTGIQSCRFSSFDDIGKQSSHGSSSAAHRKQLSPGGQTQARWRVDPHRDTSWNWSRGSHPQAVQQPKGLVEIDESLRCTWAVDVSALCTAAAQRQSHCLNSRSVKIRRRAAKVLGIFGVAAANNTKEVVSGLMDGDSTVRERSLWAVGQLGSAGCSHAKVHLQKLRPSSELCQQALKDAKKLCDKVEAAAVADIFKGSSALQASKASRFTKTENMRSTALNVTSSAPVLKPSAHAYLGDRLQNLRRDMKSDDPNVRLTSVRAVRSVDVESIPMPPWELAGQLVVMLEDPLEQVCTDAANAFAKMAVASRAHLAHRLDSGNLHSRREALHCLKLAGVAASPHLEVIQRMAKDPDEEVRNTAKVCLGLISEGEKEVESDAPQGTQRGAGATQKALVPDGCMVQARGGSWRLKPGESPGQDAYFESVKRLKNSVMQSVTSRSKWLLF